MITAALAAALLLTGCGGGSSSSPKGGGGGDDQQRDGGTDHRSDLPTHDQIAAAIHRIDISGAHGFVITADEEARPSATLQAAGNGTSLTSASVYKVLEDGRLERVAVEDSAGAELARGAIRPRAVNDLSADFVTMEFAIRVAQGEGEWVWYSEERRIFLVHKTSGLAYDATELFSEARGSEVRTDAAGNIYWRKMGFFGRFDTSSLGHGPLAVEALPTGGTSFLEFEVHPSGAFMTYAGHREHGSGIVRRFVDLKTNTVRTISTLPGPTCEETLSRGTLRGLDGELYLLALGGTPEVCDKPGDRERHGELLVYHLHANAQGEPSYTRIDDFEVVTTSGEPVYASRAAGVLQSFSGIGASNYATPDHSRHVIGGRLFYRTWGERFWEFDLPNRRVVYHDTAAKELQSLEQVLLSDSFIWFLGRSANQDTIVRYDPVTREARVVPVGDDLELARFELITSDRVLFEGFSVLDNAQVRGELSIDGELTNYQIIDPFEPAIVYLQPIHPAGFVVVDGSAQDWPLERRVLFADGKGPAGDAPLAYSELTGGGRYFGLLEFEGAINPAHGTVIHLSQTHRLELWRDAAELIAKDSREALSALSGRVAFGEAVEFSLPLEALGTATPTAMQVQRVADVIWGEVETVSAERSGEDWQLTVVLRHPIGDETVEIKLDASHTLFIDKDAVELDDGDGRAAVVGLGGTVVAQDSDRIVVRIPADALDETDALTPEVISLGTPGHRVLSTLP